MSRRREFVQTRKRPAEEWIEVGWYAALAAFGAWAGITDLTTTTNEAWGWHLLAVLCLFLALVNALRAVDVMVG